MLPSGLTYLPNYISQQEHDYLISVIDQQPWLSDLKRRVQHYGYRYNYTKRSVDLSMYIGELPDWGQKLGQRLLNDKWFTNIPDQLIVNEYQPGQGISAHIDCVPCFGSTITSLSLGSSCVMDFINSQTGEVVSLLLEPCSLLIMSNESRYKWQHGIKPRKSDIYKGEKRVRKRRVSLTFRIMILN
ncbi:alpha-ketoglutarate-dependent dioxygenase AlkB [Anabaena azotica]|uniref:Alpha-ketoglutarate-dependent dioxygenase AlkB n=1 Tax=Anabaena azotica FACHB-119 TaxID=947527 RepID=A0ABR8D1V0_9NOST|nr:alpha-ketoglutarate-dependent dioxygenase AlkB [Anabaena azotica]MBD2501107.1 alpha-ketoglutarate-dependent dioxygenase AlkB [Anabaena azotica FACHB-119]